MSEKPLLLPSAKIGVLASRKKAREYLQALLFCVGVLVVLVGLVNVISRVADMAGADTIQTAFAPLGSLNTLPARGAAALPPGIATTTPITPTHIRIAAIGVDASIEQVGKKADGSMATPSNFENVGWYKLGSQPGAGGNAVFAGHVNNALTKAGVFQYLSNVKVGDSIVVADASGRSLTYVVFETNQYKTTQAPATSIFSGVGPSQVVLITCDGAWDAASHTYDKRFVVYARLTTR
jgi:LPXTG-site transpeptidase (sortase) family protein